MKKAYLVRYGAYGDHVHMSCVIPVFKQLGYHITFEYNYKGAQIHFYNPNIDRHIMHEPFDKKNTSEEAMKKRYYRLLDMENQFDVFVNFTHSLEDALIASEKTAEYFWPLRLRREKNTNICYYDQSMMWAGLTKPEYMGKTGEIYFTQKEHNHVLKQLEHYKDKFVVLWALRGTMYQKAVYPMAKELCTKWIERYPNSVIITTGDEFCKQFEWEHPNVIHKSARMPFRQALLMSKYVDLVVTPETGLGIGAGAFGTPKIMLLTAASIKNIVGNDSNDFSLQSEAWCSPCTRAIYNTYNCEIDPKTKLPICVSFDKDKILNQMEKVYDLHRVPKRNEVLDGRPIYM